MNAQNKNRSLPISILLKEQNSPLASLCNKAKSIKELDHKLKNLLDPSLRDHFQLANINADMATLLVSSSSWGTRLRYNIPTILDILNNQLDFSSVKTIRIKLNIPILDDSVSNKNQTQLSDNSAKFLHEAANNFTDPQLRECFIKLSKNKIK
jgi:hypothetical protein